jgi:hypothetical protein
VWAYCIVWWFIQDIVKVWTYWALEKYDVFSYRSMLEPDSHREEESDKAPLVGQRAGSSYGTGTVQH